MQPIVHQPLKKETGATGLELYPLDEIRAGFEIPAPEIEELALAPRHGSTAAGADGREHRLRRPLTLQERPGRLGLRG